MEKVEVSPEFRKVFPKIVLTMCIVGLLLVLAGVVMTALGVNMN